MKEKQEEIILKGRLNGSQRNRLAKLMNMMYSPSELADEVGFERRQVYRVYIPLGCPHDRDKHNRIWINGIDFRNWVMDLYRKKELSIKEAEFATDVETMFSRFHIFWQIFKYLTMLVIAVVIVTVFPATLVATTKLCKEKTWRSLGLGFVLWICAIAAAIILSITLLALPLAFILLGVLGITWTIAKVYAAMFIGSLLIKPKKMTKGKLFGIVALGGFIIMVVGMIPILGWLATFIVVMIAFGAFWTYEKEKYDKLNLQKL